MVYPLERPAAVAGSFYPENRNELANFLESLLASKCDDDKKKSEKLRGLIVPHAGYIYSAKTAALGYCRLSRLSTHPKNFILIGPSHNAYFGGIATCSFSSWRTPLGKVPSSSIQELCGKSEMVIDSPEAFAREHCLEVQLPFMQKVFGNGFRIFPCLTSQTDEQSIAEYFSSALGNDDNFLIVSSDLSHFLSQKQAERTDAESSRIITSLELASANKIDACGRTGIAIAMILARKFGWTCYQLGYSTSFEASGDDRRVVGYGAFAFYK